MPDEGIMAEARAKATKQEREEVYVALQYATSFHCLVEEWKDCEEIKPNPKEKCVIVNKKSEGTKHQTEWCAEADRYRCMRSGVLKQIYEDARQMHRTEILVKKFGKMEKAPSGRHELVRRTDRQGEVFCGAESVLDVRDKEWDRS